MFGLRDLVSCCNITIWFKRARGPAMDGNDFVAARKLGLYYIQALLFLRLGKEVDSLTKKLKGFSAFWWVGFGCDSAISAAQM
jgi:hypothetical protein